MVRRHGYDESGSVNHELVEIYCTAGSTYCTGTHGQELQMSEIWQALEYHEQHMPAKLNDSTILALL